MQIDKRLLEYELEQLSRQKRALFAARAATRALPIFALRGDDFSIWSEKNKDKHLCAVLRAVSLAYSAAYVYKADEKIKNITVAAADSAAKAAKAATHYAYAAYAAAYAAAAYATYGAYAADAASRVHIHAGIETSTEFYTSDIKSLARGEECPLWFRGAPEEWQELNERYLGALRKRGLEYWVEEYLGWLRGEFDHNRLRHCAQMPESIAQGSAAAQLQYLSNLERTYFGEARVLYLGEASAGKTSLIRRLHNEDINKDEAATPRVEIRTRKISNTEGEQLRVHDWDFGGQVLMHAMHQFFLSENVVYVIVADMRREESVEYWLEYARIFGRGAPTLVILNKVDMLQHGDQTRLKFDPEAVKKHYPFVLDFIKISCSKSTNLDEVKKLVNQLCWRQQVLGGETPKSWFEVKERVQAENQDHISFGKFAELCSQCQLPEADVDPTISALTQLGAALYYPEIGAKVVLNPEWMTKAIYYAINAAEAVGLQYLTPNSLANLYEQANQEQKLELHVDKDDAEFLLRLMLQFELAFIDHAHPGSYYLPMVAPVTMPESGHDFNSGGYFRFRLEFLPPALFYRFITRCGAEVLPGKLWRTGAQLLAAGAIVQVEYLERSNCILLRTRPGESGDFIETLRTRLYELLGDSYQEIDYQVEYHRADGHIFLWTQVLAYLKRGSEWIPDIKGEEVQWQSNDLRLSFARSNQQPAAAGRELEQLANQLHIHVNVQGSQAVAHGGEANAHAEAQASAEVNIEIQLSELGAELKELRRDLERSQRADPSLNEQQIQRLLGEIEYMREDIKEAKGKKPSASLKRSLQSGWENIQQAAKGIEKVDRVAQALNRVRELMTTIPWENFTGLF